MVDATEERILAVAIREFASNGYDKASTNSIMKDTGMAKGLLFHYFTNKQQLYLACLKRVLQEFEPYFREFVKDMPYDLIQRIEAFLEAKQEFALAKPIEFQFMTSVTQLPAEIGAPTRLILANWQQSHQALLMDYDREPWAPEVNEDDAIELIMLTLDGLDRKWAGQITNLDPQKAREILSHAKRMLELLRRSFYR